MEEINDMVYKQKYLKYKAKYLELQEQSGGEDGEKIKFQNCAVLLLRIKKENTLATLKLIHSGDTNDTKHNYYTVEEEKQGTQKLAENVAKLVQKKQEQKTEKPETEKNYLVCVHNNRLRCFINQYFKNGEDIKTNDEKRYTFGDRTCKLTNLITAENYLMNDKYIHKTVNIYIIRHGAGTHNLKPDQKNNLLNHINKFIRLDPSLTQEGKTQATSASSSINKSISSINKSISFDKLFASRLKRTRETIDKLGVTTIPNVIYILPCAHELIYNPGKDGKCDAHQTGLKNIREGLSKVGIKLGENLEKCSESKFRKKNEL